MESIHLRKLAWLTRLLALLLPLLAIGAQTAIAHGISDADKKAMIEGGYLRYIGLGASHMLTGYDHLLFLFGVMFFLTTFKEVVKFITAFTLGHCITLIAATFLKISANYFLVDAVIAMTVFYKGFDNVDGFKKYLGTKSPNLLVLVFLFGLIHGFGLSTRLQQLPLGSDQVVLLLQILSFNVGVEVGQVLALAAMLLVLGLWRRSQSFAKFSAAANVGLMVAGILLFLMQMHGYTHQVFVDELAFNQSAHLTAHARVDEWSDPIKIELPAGRDLEFKLILAQGATVHYEWQAGGDLVYDFHGEPTGAKAGEFTSFEKGTSRSSTGSLNAPFSGRVGWWWKNEKMSAITVMLKLKGAYQLADK